MALAALRRHTENVIGALKKDEPFAIFAYMEETLVGGMIGRVFYNWLYADVVWVEEEFRRRGIGAKVMKAAEAKAREMKLGGIYLWTETWQAPDFYAKLGYQQFVEFKNCPPGHSRIGFRKNLT